MRITDLLTRLIKYHLFDQVAEIRGDISDGNLEIDICLPSVYVREFNN